MDLQLAGMGLSDIELQRYKKHLQLSQVGEAGQAKLKNASVLVVGAGGLGSPVLLYLAAAGIGRISIIDADRVSIANLQRQVLYATSEVDELKVESALKRLHQLNPEICVDTYSERLDPANAEQLITGHWPVVDCTDNLETRLIINDTCARLGIPFVYGAVFEFEGRLSVFDASRGPCLRCMIPEIPAPGVVPDAEEYGLLNTVPGVIGMLEANEVLKLILDIGEPLIGKLVLFDSLSTSLTTIRIKKNADCPACSHL